MRACTVFVCMQGIGCDLSALCCFRLLRTLDIDSPGLTPSCLDRIGLFLNSSLYDKVGFSRLYARISLSLSLQFEDSFGRQLRSSRPANEETSSSRHFSLD
mmetsp:Transcript_33964/g.67270  ORF Transcript_33964/g.67270 Transcript_33964/m.67270 type:complete len:101 (-) Transcript_33964:2662-2964(-)